MVDADCPQATPTCAPSPLLIGTSYCTAGAGGGAITFDGSLAELAREEVPEEVERAYGDTRFTFGSDYLLPKPIDPRILAREAAAVARQAVSEGISLRPVEPAAYQESLEVRLGTGREMLRGLILRARQKKLRVALSDGANETVVGR